MNVRIKTRADPHAQRLDNQYNDAWQARQNVGRKIMQLSEKELSSTSLTTGCSHDIFPVGVYFEMAGYTCIDDAKLWIQAGSQN